MQNEKNYWKLWRKVPANDFPRKTPHGRHRYLFYLCVKLKMPLTALV